MNSIKQNPFLTILIGTTLFLSGVFAFLGIKGGSKYEAAKNTFDDDYGAVNRMEKLPLYPTPDNVNAKKKALDEYRKSIEEFSALYTKYHPDLSKQISTQQFTQNVVSASDEVANAFKATESKLPTDFFLGFEAYRTELAKSEATILLDYQLSAIKELMLGMAEAAEAQPLELLRIYREKIPEETGAAYQPLEDDVSRKFSYEIVFKGSEKSVRDFITKLGKKESYYCVIRSMRINNEKKDLPPMLKDAKFKDPEVRPPSLRNFFPDEASTNEPSPEFPVLPEESPLTDVADTLADPGNEEAGDAAVEIDPPLVVVPDTTSIDSSRILYQVLGNEELKVFVRFDILMFFPTKELPKP